MMVRGIVAGLELTAQAVEPDAVHARQLDDACREEGNLPLPRAEVGPRAEALLPLEERGARRRERRVALI